MTSVNNRGELRALAGLLGIEQWQAAVLLTSAGIKVDIETGEFDTSKLLEFLGARRQPPAIRKEARAEVIRGHREELRKALVEAGLQYVGDDLPRGALFEFRTAGDGEEAGRRVNVLSYVAVSLNRFSQVSFSVNHLRDEEVDWVALVAVPLRRRFLYRRTELLERAGGERDSMSITIRAGTSDADSFEQRLGELLQA